MDQVLLGPISQKLRHKSSQRLYQQQWCQRLLKMWSSQPLSGTMLPAVGIFYQLQVVPF
uniref:Uncharacterized protein n=1 Tax=Romanomermis culicivorax TaxID=13658 RepID=A0A915IE51_ROMCU